MLSLEHITIIRRSFASGNILAPYNCSDNAIAFTVQNTNKCEYEIFTTALLHNNFKQIASTASDYNFFNSFSLNETDSPITIHTAFYSSTNTAKIFWGSEQYLPYQVYADNKKLSTPSLTQLGRIAVYQKDNGAPGMLYILQLEDGRYIIIDGGPSDQLVYPIKKDTEGGWISDGLPRKSNTEYLLENFLIEHNPNEKTKPVIACWIFTHAHHDHLELAIDFIKNHHKKTDLQMIAYNFPDFDSTDYLNGSSQESKLLARTLLNTVKRYYPKISRWIMHSGQQAIFSSCKINVIFTHEDLYPIAQYSPNCSSIAFTVELGNKKICFLGDCDSNSTLFLSKNYSDELKSNILQVTHHGANGGNLSLYQKINPQICLWPVSDYAADTNPKQKGIADGYDFNKWLWENVETHYFENQTHTIICEK